SGHQPQAGLPTCVIDAIIRARSNRLKGVSNLNRIARNLAWIAVLILLAYVLKTAGPVQRAFGNQPQKLTYTELLKKVNSGEVKSAQIEKTRITGTLKQPSGQEYVGDLP